MVPTGPLRLDVPVLSAGCDWLTATAHTARTRAHLADWADAIAQTERELGDDVRPRRLQDYEGYGSQHVFFGNRPDSAILRLGDRAAWRNWEHICSEPVRVTRVDWQVTIAGGEWCTDMSSVHESEALECGTRLGRPFDVTHLVNKGTGQTLYIGSRSSQAYGRCYDKHAETPLTHPPGSWRYEVELKRDLAGASCAAIADGVRTNDRAAAFVHTWFSGRGLRPLFDLSIIAPTCHVTDRLSDTQRRLRYLRAVVVPMCQKLIDAGAGGEMVASFDVLTS